jgi:hypothetical protein
MKQAIRDRFVRYSKGPQQYANYEAVADIAELIVMVDTLTAERDELRTGLEQRDDEHIHELGNVGLDLEHAQHELAVWKPLLTAVCVVATDGPGEMGDAIKGIQEQAMRVAVISGFVYVGVENDYDMNLRKDALSRVCKELRLPNFDEL